MRSARFADALAALILAVATPASANIRLFSYDPANAETREAAGALTFEFRQFLLSTKVLNVRATEAQATADLKPVSVEALGPGGLTRLIGPGAPQRDLYEVLPLDEGPPLISAFCPGSRRAWMAFPRLRLNQDIRVFVLGDEPVGGGQSPPRLCRTLDFNFHGEWLPPPGVTLEPPPIGPPKFPK